MEKDIVCNTHRRRRRSVRSGLIMRRRSHHAPASLSRSPALNFRASCFARPSYASFDRAWLGLLNSASALSMSSSDDEFYRSCADVIVVLKSLSNLPPGSANLPPGVDLSTHRTHVLRSLLSIDTSVLTSLLQHLYRLPPPFCLVLSELGVCCKRERDVDNLLLMMEIKEHAISCCSEEHRVNTAAGASRLLSDMINEDFKRIAAATISAPPPEPVEAPPAVNAIVAPAQVQLGSQAGAPLAPSALLPPLEPASHIAASGCGNVLSSPVDMDTTPDEFPQPSAQTTFVKPESRIQPRATAPSASPKKERSISESTSGKLVVSVSASTPSSGAHPAPSSPPSSSFSSLLLPASLVSDPPSCTSATSPPLCYGRIFRMLSGHTILSAWTLIGRGERRCCSSTASPMRSLR